MFNKKLMAVVVLAAVMFVVPSWGAQFKRKAPNDQQFLQMCINGDTKGVVEAIKTGANVNAKNNHGNTALMSATKWGGTENVNTLIEAGADDLTDNEVKTALIHAANSEHSNTATVNALIMAGSDVKHKDNNGKTALDYARKNDKLKGTYVLKRLEELSR